MQGGDPDNLTIALKLDFVPLWLAKISITPAMKEEHPELAERLKQYQLRAKDVLAAAFLLERYSPDPEAPVMVQRGITTHGLYPGGLYRGELPERTPALCSGLLAGGFELPKIEPAKTGITAKAAADAIDRALRKYGYTLASLFGATEINFETKEPEEKKD